MRAWRNLGVVETIYEEELENSSASSPSLSQSPSSPQTPLRSRIEAWSQATGTMPDVLIYVQGTCFPLHKDPLSRRSAYLKRHLTELSELTLPPQLKITGETFSLVVDFCYGNRISVTPINLAALRVAAELLQMTQTNGEGDENLKQMTESYFQRVVAVNPEYTLIVFRSCLVLLPEAETAASLVGSCIEALSMMASGDGIDSVVDDLMRLRSEDFETVVESMHHRYACHDLLYRIVDLFMKERNGKITEEQRSEICRFIDCNKLSPEFLVHAVQNPRMPLRFIVRAMLAEQLNARHSFFSASNHHYSRQSHGHLPTTENTLTLGAILQRESAIRQAAQLRSAMDATNSRIENLEKELDTMRKLLLASEKERVSLDGSRSVLNSGRSASFHVSSTNKVERGERGASSSLSLRFNRDRVERAAGVLPSSPEQSYSESPTVKKNIGQMLIKGLKIAFGVSKHGSKKKVASKFEADKVRDGDADADDEGYLIAMKDHTPAAAYQKSGFLV